MDGKAVKVFLFGCSALLFGLIVAQKGENTANAPSPQAVTAPQQAAQTQPPAVKIEYDSETVAVGASIFSQAQVTYSPGSTYIDVWGSGYPDAAAALFFPENLWNSLSEEDRNALTVFIQSEIPNIRSDPDKYIEFAKGAAIHKRLRSNILNIADGRYVIMATIECNGKWINNGIVAEGSKVY